MRESGNSQKIAAILMLLASLAASAVLAVRWRNLHAELQTANEKQAVSTNRAALATFDNVSLPTNRRLTVCNNSLEEATVSAVTAFYWDANGKLKNFNSAKNQWHTWRISAGATQPLSLIEANGAGWDGSVVFYAMDIHRQGKDSLLSGTSEDLKSGCIRAAEGQSGGS